MRFTEEDFIYRIMGIDNGSDNMGLVVADLDLRSNQYNIIHSETLDGTKLSKMMTGVALTRSPRWARQNALKSEVLSLLDLYRPNTVAVETPFHRPGRTMSFQVLVETLVFVRQAVEEYDIVTDLDSISPGEAKRAVQTKNFTMKKAVIKDCVLALDNVHFDRGIDKDNLSPDEYDAVAVSIAHGIRVRKLHGFDRS
jgi:Holliday junction resolvasome RuvABC endonuclease subunit